MAKTVAKLIALYTEPADPAEFDRLYCETHMPLVEKIPGLRGVEVLKVQKNLMGGEKPYYMMATLTFDSMDALKAGLASPEGQAAGANIMGFAGKYLTMLSSEATVIEGVPTA